MMKPGKCTFMMARGSAALPIALLFAAAAAWATPAGMACAQEDHHGEHGAAEHAEKAAPKHEGETSPKGKPAGRPGREGRPPGPPAFDDIDKDGDGAITRNEFNDFHAKRRPPHGAKGSKPKDADRGHPPHGDRKGPTDDDRGRGRPHGDADAPRRGPQDRGFDGPPRHPAFRDLDTSGDGYISMREWNAFHHDRGPRGGRGGGEFRGDRGDRGPEASRGGRGGRGRGEFQGDRGGRGGSPGAGRFGGPPPRPSFEEIDANGDGSITKQEFLDFRAKRGPRGPREDQRDMPKEESF